MLERRAVSGIMLTLLVVSMLTLAFNIQPVKSDWTWTETIYIKADGSIEPDTAPISTIDNVTYTLTDNIVGDVPVGDFAIIVQRSNIVVDGAGFTVQSSGGGNGFYLLGINNVTIKKTNIISFDNGIHLEVSSFNIISKNNITNGDTGLYLSHWSNNNMILGNNITDGRYGVRFSTSSNNTLCKNNITNNSEIGVYLDGSLDPSNNNTLSGNTITENWYGVYLFWSPNNVLVNNSFVGNRYSFGVGARLHRLSDFVQNVDTSNTVDDKPVYYWVDRQNMDVPLDAGYVALVNSTNITIQGLELKNNYQGLLLAYTTNSHVTDNNITDNWIGVELYNSSHNSLSRGRITNNEHGILIRRSSKNNFLLGNNITNSNDQGLELFESSDNTVLGNNITDGRYGVGLWQRSHNNSICGNNITNNSRGVWLSSSSNNTLSENNIANNYYGVGLEGSSTNNKFYHNNFIDNSQQVYIYTSGYANFWDDDYPSGGNYWSNHTGVDVKSGPNQDQPGDDGIGDSPYVIDETNQDNYPLMSIWEDVDLEPPVASFTYSPTDPFVKIPVEFDASASYDPDGNITWYKWDFGKGYTVGTYHTTIGTTYTDPGNYTVTLTVTDNEGATDTETTTLTVRTPINPQEGEVTLNPIDDTYTDANNPDENYGDQTTLYVSNITEGVAWLKFDLGAVPDGAVVDDALLKLHALQPTETYDVCAHWCSDNSWTESTLTYSNMPSFNASQFIQSVYRFSYGDWGSWGVGDAVRRSVDGIHDGPDIVTIVISGKPVHYLYESSNIPFHSKESLYVPELIVHWIGTDTLEDTTPPTIGIPSRIPDGDILPDQEVTVSVNVTDVESGVKNVTLSYSINEGATWTDVPMIKTTGNTYVGEIPELPAETSVQYKIIAYDNTGNFAVEGDAGQYHVHVAVQVGVEAGDWIKYDYTVTGWPSGTPRPEWLKVEILSVEGTTASVKVTMHMSDGTEQSDTVNIDVATGSGTFQGLSGFVISASSKTGDTIYMSGYGNVTIDSETTRTYAGASRTVVYSSFSQYGAQLTYYWDKPTGIMVEASTTSGGMTGTAKAIETNMWEAAPSPFWMQWWLITIVAVVIVALAGTVYFLKKRKPPTPTAPTTSTEGTIEYPLRLQPALVQLFAWLHYH